jgi:hypothetical protein
MRSSVPIRLSGLLLAGLPTAPLLASEPRTGTPAPLRSSEVSELLRDRGFRASGPVTTRGRMVIVEGDTPSGTRMLFVIDPQTRDIAGQKPLPRR